MVDPIPQQAGPGEGADIRVAAEQARVAPCTCEKCMPFDVAKPETLRMILCATCGNKRCPHATDHRNACTDSNKPGQPGSSWEFYAPPGDERATLIRAVAKIEELRAALASLEAALQPQPSPVEAQAVPDLPVARNQCDGCARGIPLDNGFHRGPGSWDIQCCTADRYSRPTPAAADLWNWKPSYSESYPNSSRIKRLRIHHPDGSSQELVDSSVAASPAAAADYDAHQANGLAWAVSCWQAEVSRRPLVNVHRRTLDDTWRQVIRYFGGDPVKLLGPDHDTLHMQAQEDRAWKP